MARDVVTRACLQMELQDTRSNASCDIMNAKVVDSVSQYMQREKKGRLTEEALRSRQAVIKACIFTSEDETEKRNVMRRIGIDNRRIHKNICS